MMNIENNKILYVKFAIFFFIFLCFNSFFFTNWIKDYPLIIFIVMVFIAGSALYFKNHLRVLLAFSLFPGVFYLEVMHSTVRFYDFYTILLFAGKPIFFVSCYLKRLTRELVPFLFVLILFLIFMCLNLIRWEELNKFYSEFSICINEIDLILIQGKRFAWLIINLMPLILMLEYIKRKEDFFNLLKFYLLIQLLIMIWCFFGGLECLLFSNSPVPVWKFGESFFRFRGGDFEPSYYGYHLLTISPFYYFLYLEKNYLFSRKFHLSAIALLLLTMIFTFSSGTWMFLPFAILCIFLFSSVMIRFSYKFSKKIIIFIVTAFVLSGILFFQYYEITFIKILTPLQSSGSRLANMERSLKIFSRFPFLGGGGIIEGSNVYLELLSMYGVLGFVFFLGIFVFLLFCVFRNLNIKNNFLQSSFMISLILIYIIQLVNNNFLRYNFFIIYGFIILWSHLDCQGDSRAP